MFQGESLLALTAHIGLPGFELTMKPISGSAWDYDEKTEEYYLHLYVSKQPDFNWDNPDVRKAVYDLMRFWLDRGCDGFRVRSIANLWVPTDNM